MAGLDDINPNDPAGTETPTLGDNRIRALAAKTIEAVDVEHSLAGPHAFLVGSAAQRPAAGYAGRLYILAAAGVAVELQYDTGATWINLTSNQTSEDVVADLAAHIAANPIDHPDESITHIKIAQGAILKKHLDSSGDTTALELLVNGENADPLHIHGVGAGKKVVFTTSDTWTCPDGITSVEFEGRGGGGGGGGGNYPSGGGGGGGYVKGYYTTVPGVDYTVTVGLGGNGGGVTHDGYSGEQTSFNSSIIAYGGGGGTRGKNIGYSAPNPGGAGGEFMLDNDVGSGDAGDAGGDGVKDDRPGMPDYAGAGGRGGGLGGSGGDEGSVGIDPTPGIRPGGGGGGAWGSVGANGAQGLAILRW